MQEKGKENGSDEEFAGNETDAEDNEDTIAEQEKHEKHDYSNELDDLQAEGKNTWILLNSFQIFMWKDKFTHMYFIKAQPRALCSSICQRGGGATVKYLSSILYQCVSWFPILGVPFALCIRHLLQQLVACIF